MAHTEVQKFYQVLSYAQVQEHYIIWQPTSHFNQAILHYARRRSANHFFNLLCVSIHILQFNAL